MTAHLIEAIQKIFSPEAAVFIVSLLPITELRGGIPLALSFGMTPAKAFWLSVLGNSIFVIPALVCMESGTNFLRRWKPYDRFFAWVFARTRSNSDAIQKYGAIGLALFVAVPLPMTGAWSGCIAAYLFGIKFRYAFPSIIAGVLLAGVIVLLTCMGAVTVFLRCIGF